MKKLSHKYLKNIYSTIIFILLSAIILTKPTQIINGAKEGLVLSAGVVIPCLFPFAVASIFFYKSGGLFLMGKLFEKPAKNFFGLSGNEFGVVILSLLGGYPLGAKILNEMFKDNLITKKRAERLLLFSVHASPSFFISAVGSALLRNEKIGLILFASNIISAFILLFIFGKNKSKENQSLNTEYFTLGDSLVLSVSESASVFLNITAWIIFFSAIKGYTENLTLPPALKTIIYIFFEVTIGCEASAKVGVPLYMYSFILGFGGLSTVCQVKSAAKEINPPFYKVFLGRALQGIAAAILTYVYFSAFPTAVNTISNSVPVKLSGFIPNFSSLSLAFLAILFLIYINT